MTLDPRSGVDRGPAQEYPVGDRTLAWKHPENPAGTFLPPSWQLRPSNAGFSATSRPAAPRLWAAMCLSATSAATARWPTTPAAIGIARNAKPGREPHHRPYSNHPQPSCQSAFDDLPE